MIDIDIANRDVFRALGIQVDLRLLFAGMEQMFLPDLRKRIKEEGLVGADLVAITFFDFTEGMSYMFLHTGKEEILSAVQPLFRPDGLSPEALKASFFVWSTEKQFFPFVIVLMKQDLNHSVILNTRWAINEPTSGYPGDGINSN